MAKKRTMADADAEIAALKAQLEARGAGVEVDPVQRFPCVMYRKAKVTEKHPNGYEPRRVQVVDKDGKLDEAGCELEVARLEKTGWLHSPESLVA